MDFDKAGIELSSRGSRGSLMPEDLESTPERKGSTESHQKETAISRSNRVGSVFDMRKDVQRILQETKAQRRLSVAQHNPYKALMARVRSIKAGTTSLGGSESKY